jgi:hypothetical protein
MRCGTRTAVIIIIIIVINIISQSAQSILYVGCIITLTIRSAVAFSGT